MSEDKSFMDSYAKMNSPGGPAPGGEAFERLTAFLKDDHPRKPKKILTEEEKHKGWIENLRNEERTMKE